MGAMNQTRDPSNNLVRNYPEDNSWFGEASGTAMLAATVYRMTALAPEMFNSSDSTGGEAGQLLEWAETSRLAVTKCIAPEGLVSPVVNPLKHLSRTPLETGSPEGQCFAVQMFQAYGDWVAFRERRG